MNQEFAELKARVNRLKGEERKSTILQMRENLKKRNNGNAIYNNAYTQSVKRYNIDQCDVEELFEIDGDMSAFGV